MATTKKTQGTPTRTGPKTLTVKKGTALAELVEEGEVFERAKVSGKVWRGLYLLNMPAARKG